MSFTNGLFTLNTVHFGPAQACLNYDNSQLTQPFYCNPLITAASKLSASHY